MSASGNKHNRFANFGMPKTQIIVNPAAIDNDLIVTSVAPVAGSDQSLTVAAQPNVPRALTLRLTDANASIKRMVVTVYGKDVFNRDISEVFVAVAGSTVTGNLPFAVVSGIKYDLSGTVTGGGSDVVKMGTSDKLGIDTLLGDTTDVYASFEGDLESGSGDPQAADAGTVAINQGGLATYTPAAATDGALDYTLYIRSTYNKARAA